MATPFAKAAAADPSATGYCLLRLFRYCPASECPAACVTCRANRRGTNGNDKECARIVPRNDPKSTQNFARTQQFVVVGKSAGKNGGCIEWSHGDLNPKFNHAMVA
jgi:hypothetical protein